LTVVRDSRYNREAMLTRLVLVLVSLLLAVLIDDRREAFA